LRRGASPSFVDQGGETVVLRGRKDEAGVLGPSLKSLPVDTFHAEEKDIGAIRDASDFEARVGL